MLLWLLCLFCFLLCLRGRAVQHNVLICAAYIKARKDGLTRRLVLTPTKNSHKRGCFFIQSEGLVYHRRRRISSRTARRPCISSRSACIQHGLTIYNPCGIYDCLTTQLVLGNSLRTVTAIIPIRSEIMRTKRSTFLIWKPRR